MNKNKLKKDKELELQKKIFVGGLPSNADEAKLEEYFSKYGAIEDILVNRSSRTGSSRGCAFILFEEKAVAQKLIAGEEIHELEGKKIDVKKCFKKGTKPEKKKLNSEGTSSPRDLELHNQVLNQEGKNSTPFAQMIESLNATEDVALLHQDFNLRFNKLRN